jgi:hypothetical protein
VATRGAADGRKGIVERVAAADAARIGDGAEEGGKKVSWPQALSDVKQRASRPDSLEGGVEGERSHQSFVCHFRWVEVHRASFSDALRMTMWSVTAGEDSGDSE